MTFQCVVPVYFIEGSHVRDELGLQSIPVKWLTITASDCLISPRLSSCLKTSFILTLVLSNKQQKITLGLCICTHLNVQNAITRSYTKIRTECVSYWFIIVRIVGVTIQIQFLSSTDIPSSLHFLLLLYLTWVFTPCFYLYSSHTVVVVY